MCSRLNAEQMQELHDWLEKKEFPIVNIPEHFADGSEVAKLITTIYPDLVENEQFLPRQSNILRVSNWTNLNHKVLAGLKLFQNRDRIEDFVTAKRGAMEVFLYKVMQHEKQISSADTDDGEKSLEDNGDVVVIKSTEKIGDNKIVNETKLVLLSVYENAAAEMKDKKEVLALLEQKIANLQNSLNVKDARIASLKEKLAP